MRYSSYLIVFLIGISVTLFSSCNRNVSYESLIQQGLNSDVRVDSLFLGYYFGMERQEFRDLSWQMNQQGLMTGFVNIEYNFDELKGRALKKFYPEFTDDKISRFPVTVSYNAWAPWNEEFWPEVLMVDLKEYFEEEYQTQFHWVYVPPLEKYAYVSVEGNREIRIYRDSESTAKIEYIDLTVHNPLDS